MARSDLLESLVKAGATGDSALFRRTTEAIIAEERAKKHDVLANRLQQQLEAGVTNGVPSSPSSTSLVRDLMYERVPQRSFEDLVLANDVRLPLQEVAEEHHRADLLRSYGLAPRHRILLSGPPGNGKTSIAETLAYEIGLPLVVVRYEGLIASYLGETAARLSRLLSHARTRACILFFDEFDTIAKERGDQHETGEIKRVVSSLLLQIDELPSHTIVVTATNHGELLDRAVWRRFQVHLKVDPPTRQMTEEFFRRAAARLAFDLSISPRTLAEKMKGLSFSELEGFVADVARRYVLALPDAKPREIVAQQLRQWQSRIDPSNL